jgi:hypothetical protein
MPCRPVYHWGPFLWGILHNLMIIDEEEPLIQEHTVRRMLKHINAAVMVIPCMTCAIHFSTFVKSLEEDDRRYERMRLFERTVLFHNEINKTHGKRIWSIEEAREYWVNRNGSGSAQACGVIIH